MSSLKKKRIDSVEVIVMAAGVGGVSTFAPTPMLEIHKQLVLSLADITMCLAIWNIYFDEEIDEKSAFETMVAKGIVASTSVVTGYMIAKGFTGLLHELLNTITLPGWVISASVAASSTAILGFTWMMLCDKRYRQRCQKSSPTLATL